MKKILVLGTVSLVVSALLVGCGSSSSTDSETSEISTGYFIDSAVANVDYNTTSGLTGTTDKFGRFQYRENDKVKLYIGNLLLGEASLTEEGLVTPSTLIEDDAKELLLLRTLQTLDIDRNVSNGIIIPQTVVTVLKNIEESSFSDYNESSLIGLLDSSILDRDYDGEIDVSESDAREHAIESERVWNEGERPDAGHEGESGSTDEHGSGENEEGHEFNLSDYPVTPSLTSELKNSLAYMGNEERLAYDVYQNLYTYHVTESATEIKQLKNISEKSEIKHIGIVQDVVKRYALNSEDVTNVVNPVANRDINISDMPSGEYDIPAIQELYNILYAKGIVSSTEALMVGCMVEVTDVDDLDRYLTLANDSNATDIVAAFEVLRNGSYNHYWAFDKGLKKAGVENGCYVEGDTLLTNKEGVYPQNEHDSEDNAEESQGNGNGQGNGNRNGQGNGHN